MFKFNQLRDMHLEITNACQASCPMCPRNINSGIENPLITVKEWTLADFKKIMCKDTLSQLDGFYFCGNYGDPIIAKDLIPMIEYAVSINPQLFIRVHTNGGARTTDWWSRLASALPQRHEVIFALDGVGSTHSLYRVGTKYDTVINNATAFIQAGGVAQWCFIKFKHNEHQEQQAKQIAEELKFAKFVVKNSSRFILEPRVPVLDRTGTHLYDIEPSTDTELKFVDEKTINSYKEILQLSTIDCQVKNNKEVFIDAYGTLFPCCWLASISFDYVEDNEAFEVRYEMKKEQQNLIDELGGLNKLNAKNNSIEDIIDSKEYQTIWKPHWDNKELITCARQCGNADFAKSKDQWIEVKQL